MNTEQTQVLRNSTALKLLIVCHVLLSTAGPANAMDCPVQTMEKGHLIGDKVNLRDSPAVLGRVLRTMAYGTPVKILEQSQNCSTIAGKSNRWIKIRVLDENQVHDGWVFGSFIGQPVVGKFTPSLTSTSRPVEAAVLHIENATYALPVISFPALPQPAFDAIHENPFDSRNYPRGEQMESIIKRCAKNGAPDQCELPAALVARHHFMHVVPEYWFDSTGAKFKTISGKYFNNGVGTGIGFGLAADTSVTNSKEIKARVLLSNVDGFPRKGLVPASTWKDWPELLTELAKWQKKQTEICGKSLQCKQRVSQLATPGRLQGVAQEFTFPGGHSLQYLVATSKSSEKAILGEIPSFTGDESQNILSDILKINFWRIVNADKTTHALRIQNMTGWDSGLNGIELIDHYCESQCGAGWDGQPDVFSVDGRIFVFGLFGIGTTSGHIFFEVLPTKMQFLGWYRWGT